MKKFKIPYIILSILIGFLAFTAILDWYSFILTNSWNESPAKIKDLQFINYTDGNIELDSSIKKIDNIQCSYTYQVNDENYKNNTLHIYFFRPNNVLPELHKQLRTAYLNDQLIPIKYNPQKPNQSTIHRSIHSGMIIYPILLIIVLTGISKIKKT